MESKKKRQIILIFLLVASSILCLVLILNQDGSHLSGSVADRSYDAGVLKKTTISDRMEGPAWFAEYHRLIRTREGDSEPAYKTGYRWKEFQKSLEKRRKSKRGELLEWIERGPGNVGGRTRSIWVDPTDTTHLSWFAGSVSGGVWKTENGGVSWRHLTKDLSNLTTSVITGSVANPDVLYVGTGEGYSPRGGFIGNGIWKSLDRGENWLPLESTLFNPKFGYTMRIVVNPEDENEVVVASQLEPTRNLEDGARRSFLHKSLDGGQTWQQTWQDSLIVQQVMTHPHRFDTLFAAVNSGGVLRSTDAGLSWDLVFNAHGSGIERIEMAVSPTDPNYLYFAAATDRYQSLLFRSSDGGNTWSEVQGKDQQNQFGNWMGGQGWYDNAIAVHPFDAHTVFVGGTGAILKISVLEEESVSGDKPLEASMEPVVDTYFQYNNRFETSSKGVHVDHHSLVLIPIDEAAGHFYILNTNDGGIAFSKDSGMTFMQTGDTISDDIGINDEGVIYPTFMGYNTAQFYGVDKMNGDDRYVGGTQDNSVWFSEVDPDLASEWSIGPRGDGFEVAWHYHDPNKILTTVQLNDFYRSDDAGENWRRVSPPRENIFETPFFARLSNSKTDPDLVFSITKSGVARSFDFADTWEVIPMPPEWKYSPFSNMIRISLATPFVTWTGLGVSEDKRMLVSVDGGSTFSATNPYEEAELGLLSGLTTHPLDEKTAYALFSAADAPKVLRTTDLGETWEDLSGFVTNAAQSRNGFPDVAVYSLLVMPFDTSRIWVGTEIGLFESLDGGLSWQYADNGLPSVSIWDMKIVNDEVVLATHGRGVWTVSFPELEGYEPPEAVALTPILAVEENGLGGRINGSFVLRSDFDSVFIEAEAPVNDLEQVSTRFQMENVQALVEGAFSVSLEGLSRDTIIHAQVSVVGYKEGKAIRNVQPSLVYGVEEEARTSYITDFDRGAGSFARLDFNIYQEDGFDSRALHSRHPYLGFHQTYLAALTFPIVVSPAYSLISYDEIAMIEPGWDGSVFGDERFFDFVAVEGTRDFGQTWEVIEGYDSRWSDNWVNNYVEDSSPVDPALIETHTMDLASVFNPGDTIYLRFRLQSDPYTEGWGWMIDHLQIQQNPVGTDEMEAEALSVQVFPNPSTDLVYLQYSLEEKQVVKISLYSISGQELAILENGVMKSAGDHQREFNAADLENGIYLFRLEIGNAVQTLKWLKL